MYQQRPLDETGSWIGDEHITYEDAAPADLNYVIGIDLALTVGGGDYTALVVAGLDAQRNIHVVEVQRDRIAPDVTVRRLFELVQRYKPGSVLIDDDNASKVFMRLLLEMARQRHISVPLSTMALRGRNKEVRAAPLRGWFLQDRVKLVRGTWSTDLHRELLEFPAGEHDDQVDALSLIGRRLAELPSPSAVQVKQRDPYEGWLYDGKRDAQGRLLMRATLDDLWDTNTNREIQRL
jgi:predicted phage terminase large subunit-like protein